MAQNLSSLAELELLITKFNSEVEKAKNNAGEDGRTKGDETDTTEGDAVAKAAAMVNDVRVFANLFDVAKTSGKEVQTQGEVFVQLVEDASDMVEEQANSFKLLGDVSEALAVIDALRRNGDIEKSQKVFTLDNYLALPGATGQAVIDETELAFSVTATAGEESLAADIALSTDETNKEYTLTVQGNIGNAAAEYKINEGSKEAETLNEAVTKSALSSDFDNATDGLEVVQGALNLDVVLSQKQSEEVTNPVSFAGKVSAELVPVITQKLDNFYFSEYDDQGSTSSTGYSIQDETVLVPSMLYLGGDFSAQAGDQIGANLTVNVANLEDYQPSGFTGIGKSIEDVASITFASNTEATISNRDGNQSRIITLLSEPKSSTVEYKYQYESDLDNQFIGTETVIQTLYNGWDYLLVDWGGIGASVRRLMN